MDKIQSEDGKSAIFVILISSIANALDHRFLMFRGVTHLVGGIFNMVMSGFLELSKVNVGSPIGIRDNSSMALYLICHLVHLALTLAMRLS